MIRYRMPSDTELPHPVAVECAERGYPHKDADGNTQFENTHFDTEQECWEATLRDVRAAVSLDASDVRIYRAELARREARLVESTLRRDAVERAHAEAEATP